MTTVGPDRRDESAAPSSIRHAAARSITRPRPVRPDFIGSGQHPPGRRSSPRRATLPPRSGRDCKEKRSAPADPPARLQSRVSFVVRPDQMGFVACRRHPLLRNAVIGSGSQGSVLGDHLHCRLRPATRRQRRSRCGSAASGPQAGRRTPPASRQRSMSAGRSGESPVFFPEPE